MDERSRPCPLSACRVREVKWVGLDVAKDAIAVGVLDGSSEATPRLEKIAHDEVSIRRLVVEVGWPGPVAGVLRGRPDWL